MEAVTRRLLVLGAGPKAVAIATKACVLAELGFAVPEVTVVDRKGVGAHWMGAAGYTDGNQLLGTPPDKDVGFPYASRCWNGSDIDHCKEVNRRMQRYSWQSYLVELGRYSGWVDRGRPQPPHAVFGAYLAWVARQIEMKLVRATVRQISVSDQKWILDCQDNHHSRTKVVGDGLVVTGPGIPIHDVVSGYVEDDERVMDGQTFWTRQPLFRDLRQSVTVAVVGTGETACSVVMALLKALPESSTIDVISPHGVHYTRGESFEENRMFSDPDPAWSKLTDGHRRQFTKRTDRGVFSVHAKRILDGAYNVETVPGRAVAMESREAHVSLLIEYDTHRQEHVYDFVVVAIGFDPRWFIEGLFDKDTRELFKSYVRARNDEETKDDVERSIDYDLSIKNMRPRLHLPMLAALSQGPGFPNLSCLGLLADRVLHPYVEMSHNQDNKLP